MVTDQNTLNFEMKYFELLDEKEIETIHENALRLLKEDDDLLC